MVVETVFQLLLDLVIWRARKAFSG